MLLVDPEQRATIDDCLEHPWVTQRVLSLTDSTDGLTGAMGSLDFSKRKMARERTLLSTLNDAIIERVIDDPHNKSTVKIWDKNKSSMPQTNAHAQSGNTTLKKGEAKKSGSAKNEEGPAAHRKVNEFMEMGGKGDQSLFGYDGESRYTVNADLRTDGEAK